MKFERPIKLLVTHQNPDLDAIGACWLWMKFGGEWFEGAELYFVPAGEEVGEAVLAAKGLVREEVVHVDTGMGPFDHHQPDNQRRDSATLRVYEYLKVENQAVEADKALVRLVTFINDNDHFASCWWPEANSDRYNFMLEEILKGVKQERHFNDREVVEFGMICLDGVWGSLKSKLSAEVDLSLGEEFVSPWGKALAIDNKNDEVVKLAQKSGYFLVVRREAETGHIRIKGVPDKGIDLSLLYKQIIERDKTGTWYLHPSKTMLLNGSSRNPNHVATTLSLKTVVELIVSLKGD